MSDTLTGDVSIRGAGPQGVGEEGRGNSQADCLKMSMYTQYEDDGGRVLGRGTPPW